MPAADRVVRGCVRCEKIAELALAWRGERGFGMGTALPRWLTSEGCRHWHLWYAREVRALILLPSRRSTHNNRVVGLVLVL
jgi:hypothetical protein